MGDLTLLGDSPSDGWYAQDDGGVSVRFAPARADKNGYLGYVYVLEFDTGVIKVGKAVDARQRLTSHRSNAEAMGRRVVAAWVSRAHGNYAENERVLIDACASRASKVIRAEYFAGVGIAEARRVARGLPFEPRNSRREQHDKARGEAFVQMWTHGAHADRVAVPRAYVAAAEQWLQFDLDAPTPDGQQRKIPALLEDTMVLHEGSYERQLIEEIAASKDLEIEEVADWSYVDALAGILETKAACVRLRWIALAHENGRDDLLAEWAVLPADVEDAS